MSVANDFVGAMTLSRAALTRSAIASANRFSTHQSLAMLHTVPDCVFCGQPGQTLVAFALPTNRYFAVGTARLDNRSEVVNWLARGRTQVRSDCGDLELSALAVIHLGRECVSQLLGDFGFCLYDRAERTAFAARDAFGVRPLFYALRGATLLVSSRADLEDAVDYDETFLAHFLLAHVTSGPWSAFRSVKRLLHGHILECDCRGLRTSRFWSPCDVAARDLPFDAARDEFRYHFLAGLKTRLMAPTPVWAELSGGVDSSSIVSSACLLYEAGTAPALSGTVTATESLGSGDESPYLQAVVKRYGLRNETVENEWAWRDDGYAPPILDEPLPNLPFYARDRRMHACLERHGAETLLSGQGSDHYLAGNYYYITDHISRREWSNAGREILAVTRAFRSTFWRVAFRFAVAPFLPISLRTHVALPDHRLPAWIDPAFSRNQNLREVLFVGVPGTCRVECDRFRREIHRELQGLPNVLRRGAFSDHIEMRYPFLYRPLVEFALGLTPQSICRAGLTKRLLREAMRGVIPDEVYHRSTKGGLDARVMWSLNRERARLSRMLAQPVLADLGCIRPRALRDATEQARCGHVPCSAFLLSALALETWLAIRAGRWQRAA